MAPTGRWPEDGNASSQTNAALRLLLTGAPLIYPNFKLARIIEQSGAVIAADDLCSSTQRLYQPVVPSEWSMRAMMEAVAEKYLLPSVCPCFTDSADRINKIKGCIEDLGIDGVVYHNLRMCALFDIESHQLRDALQGLDVPILTLHTDYSPEDTEQLRNRVEAFLEMLSGRWHGRGSVPRVAVLPVLPWGTQPTSRARGTRRPRAFRSRRCAPRRRGR